MSWTYPNSVTVYAYAQAVDGSKVAQVPTVAASGTTVYCDVQGKKPSSVYADYGLDLKEPAFLYCALSDLATFKPSYRVVQGSNQYSVVNAIPRDDGDSDLAYGLVILEGVTY
jgi:hypothetical protein